MNQMKPKDFRKYVKEALVKEGWGVEPVSPAREKKATAFAHEAERVANSAYGRVYNVSFHSISRDGAEFWKVSLHSPTGPVKYIYRDKNGEWFYSSGEGTQSTWVKAPVDETITLRELRDIVNKTVKIIVREIATGSKKMTGPYHVSVTQGRYAGQVFLARKDEETGVYYFLHPDTGTEVPLGVEGPGLSVQKKGIKEMTTTSAAEPINLPGNVRGGWVSRQGGSKRGVEGSKSLGYELTAIGREEMKRKQDSV